jgi:predicted benzoate:H+ symporter BenE
MSRLGEWLEKLVTGVVCMLLLVLFEQDPELYFWLIPSLALYTASLAAPPAQSHPGLGTLPAADEPHRSLGT